MISRFSSALALVLGCSLALTACGGSDDDQNLQLEVISVAVGAEVTLLLTSYGCDSTLVNGCLSAQPYKLDGVSLGETGAFELRESTLDNGTLQVTVRALAAGDSILVVDHQDFSDRPAHDRIRLRAAEITHVAPRVFCDDNQPGASLYPITAGSQFSVELTAMAGDTPLASGDLELIDDAAGFQVLDAPGGSRQVLAPTKPGGYTWDLIGSAGLDFAVYNPTDLQLRLSEDEGGVRVEGVISDVPVCHHEGAARATVEVTQGSCFPLVEEYEIEGKLPVDMAQGAFVLALSGKDTCQVSASLDGGKATSLTLAVDALPEPPQAGTGTPLTATPLSVGGIPEKRDSCPLITNLTNGTCEIIDAFGYILPDADCLLDWDWVKELYSIDGDDETLVPIGKVGQGLWVELRLGIRYEFLTLDFGTYSTNNLTYSSDPASGIDITSTGCIESDRQVLALRPQAPGNFTLHLDADNVYEKSSFVLPAAPIQSVLYETDAVDLKPIAGGTQAFWFVGAETPVKVRYFGTGGMLLYGVAPLHVSSEAPGTDAAMQGTRIAMGTQPTIVRLESEAVPEAHLLNVVDASAIAGVGGVKPAVFGTGTTECLEAYPTEAGGARIHGQSPTRPRVTIGGTAVVVDIQQFAPSGLCLRGYQAGSSDIGVSWGGGSAEAAFTVQ